MFKIRLNHELVMRRMVAVSQPLEPGTLTDQYRPIHDAIIDCNLADHMRDHSW